MITSTFRTNAQGWLIGTVELDGSLLDVQAKAFTEGSGYGMALDPRISKLCVAIAATGACLFNYDRGLDVNHLTDDGLALIVAEVAKAIR